jgi:BirA family biotin operon repressor/biotin-[acetyl-CoA-carboxylase] ligase
MLPVPLLERLADGEPQNRIGLAAALGIGISELDVQIEQLAAAGVAFRELDAASVQLAQAIDWIDPAVVEAGLSPETRSRIHAFERRLVLESTNRHLLAAPPPPCNTASIAIAEYQTGGRGRRGRQWRMPPGAGIALSVAWCFERRPEALSALSLAMGAVARRALLDHAELETGLKWPNDLICAGRKLGGILIEFGASPDGACHVVAGIGVNYAVPATYLAEVASWRHGAIDLLSAIAPRTMSRVAVATVLIDRIVGLLADYARSGFAPYRGEWLQAHVLDGAAVELETARGIEQGTVRGIEADGALVLENAAGGLQRFVSGDVTLRPAS